MMVVLPVGLASVTIVAPVSSAFAQAALEKALAHGGPYLVAIDVPRDSEVNPWAFIHPPMP